MAMSLGAFAGVQTVNLGTSLDGASSTLPLGSPHFAITFVDGTDASRAGAVDITLKAVGLEAGASLAAGQWWLNFESSVSRLTSTSLLVNYEASPDLQLAAYQFAADGVGGVGAGYGKFDIGVTFGADGGRFAPGSSLTLSLRADGVALSNSDFFSFTTSSNPGSYPILSAIQLAGLVDDQVAQLTHPAAFLSSPDLKVVSEPFTVVPNLPEEAPEPATLLAGFAVAALGGWRWFSRRKLAA